MRRRRRRKKETVEKQLGRRPADRDTTVTRALKRPAMPGAGRPATGSGITVSSRVSPELHARLYALRAGPSGYTVSEVIAAGVAALEAKRVEG